MVVENRTAVIQGWQESHGSQLWHVAAINDNNESGYRTDGNSGTCACHNEAHERAKVLVHELARNVYHLPSMEKVIKYHHASLGFSIKHTLLKVVKHGNLVIFPRLTASAINELFPEFDETQKRHMRHQRQNMWSTKVKHDDDMSEDMGIKRVIEHK